MSRIVTTHYRYQRPPRKSKPVALAGPAVVTMRARQPEAEPAAATAPLPANDDGKPALPPAAGQKAATVTTAGRKRFASDAPHLPMELPLSRKPVERAVDDYKRLKTAMTRRLRGDDE